MRGHLQFNQAFQSLGDPLIFFPHILWKNVRFDFGAVFKPGVKLLWTITGLAELFWGCKYQQVKRVNNILVIKTYFLYRLVLWIPKYVIYVFKHVFTLFRRSGKWLDLLTLLCSWSLQSSSLVWECLYIILHLSWDLSFGAHIVHVLLVKKFKICIVFWWNLQFHNNYVTNSCCTNVVICNNIQYPPK